MVRLSLVNVPISVSNESALPTPSGSRRQCGQIVGMAVFAWRGAVLPAPLMGRGNFKRFLAVRTNQRNPVLGVHVTAVFVGALFGTIPRGLSPRRRNLEWPTAFPARKDGAAKLSHVL